MFIAVCMVLFAFTTLPGNLYCSSGCLAFLHGGVMPSVSLMCLVNIPACLISGKVAYAALGDYMKQKKGRQKSGISRCGHWL